MAEHSTIEWTDATWNPITGCTLVDEGCRNCYAAELASTRLRTHPSRIGLARRNAGGTAKFTGKVRFNEEWLDQPLRWRRPRMIFVCAHGDLFHEAVPDEWIDRVFAIMALAPQHTFQVLTKRPERARQYLSAGSAEARLVLAAMEEAPIGRNVTDAGLFFSPSQGHHFGRWPLPNVWIGTSASDQASADKRVPELLAVPAAVLFLSAEPLLGPMHLGYIGWPNGSGERRTGLNALIGWRYENGDVVEKLRRLDWVIVGGESGRHARPMHPNWVRSLRDQCKAAGIPFFFKQWGEFEADEIGTEDRRSMSVPPGHVEFRRVGKKAAGRRLDGLEWSKMPEARQC